ncbi:MAG: hypothetical protein M3Q16_10435 [Pseudomonadota bacterium]|nr:hypothetical protein [Pseudomonadota bacterium]
MGKFSIIAIAVGVVFSSGAMAELPMSKDMYKAEKNRIEGEYKAEKARCDSLAGNVKDICLAEAKGREEVAKASLEAQYEPSRENRYEARAAKLEADYAVAKERCDDKAGNAKDICVKEAKAAEAAAKANAKRVD